MLKGLTYKSKNGEKTTDEERHKAFFENMQIRELHSGINLELMFFT